MRIDITNANKEDIVDVVRQFEQQMIDISDTNLLQEDGEYIKYTSMDRERSKINLLLKPACITRGATSFLWQQADCTDPL